MLQNMSEDKIKHSPFEYNLEEDKKFFVESWFTQEIFDTLVDNVDKQIERLKEETKKLKKFLWEITKDKKEALKEFKKHQRIFYILSYYILHYRYNNYFELIEKFKTFYNRDIQEAIEQYTREYGKNSTEKFMEYLKAYGKYEYTFNAVWKKLIELGIAEEYEMGKNRHMIEKGEDKWTIVSTFKKKHIVTRDLPKTPYYRKKIQIPDIMIDTSTKEEDKDNIF